jgi:hypothetical protein
MAGEFIADAVKDSGLSYADTNGTRIDITSQVATSYAQATSTYTLGNKTGLNTSAPADAASGTGREVTVPAITDGSVTGTGTATHWALTDGSSVLIATGPLSASQGVTSGNTFTLDAIKIIIRDATIT